MKKFFSLLAIGAMLVSTNLWAADVNDLVNREAGVQQIKYENGAISTMIIVGKKELNKALNATNPAKAKKIASAAAERDARNQFVQFLSTSCVWGIDENGEMAVKEDAATSLDKDGKQTTSGQTTFNEVEMSKEQKAQLAQACVSAVQVLCGGIDNNGVYSWVGAWNIKAAKSIKKISKIMNEANAEVQNMGKAAAVKKALLDKKELDKISNQKQKQQQATPAAQQNVTEEQTSGSSNSTVSGDADDFL